ncbi:MAG: phytoene/squalene synthase family protein [Fimbriimonadaceae bacterium]|nr:phytoene/squalene synthase family protein [Fimbriimonadaceae bacterium]
MNTFACPNDFAICRRIHRRYGTTYYFATRRFPRSVRQRTHAVYAFVRVPDEWVDNPGGRSSDESRAKLSEWRDSLVRGLRGIRPDRPEMRAFVDTVRECQIPVEEAHAFMDAMEADLSVRRYATYEDLRGYMRGSAGAVGVMMCHTMGVTLDGDTKRRALALGEAMQLTNFLRDVREDLGRGRVYLPLEDLDRFGVGVRDLAEHRVDERFRRLMRFEIDRARTLFAESDEGIRRLPGTVRRPVLLARLLYAGILDRIEAAGYDVFAGRVRTGYCRKLLCAARVAIRQGILTSQAARNPAQ